VAPELLVVAVVPELVLDVVPEVVPEAVSVVVLLLVLVVLLSLAVAVEEVSLTALPLLLIRLEEASETVPVPVWVPKVMVAIVPLPEKDALLTMAILIDPAVVVLAANIAPDTRLPWVTDGDPREAVLYVRVISIPATPSMLLPWMV
jgi:hypothetical protein